MPGHGRILPIWLDRWHSFWKMECNHFFYSRAAWRLRLSFPIINRFLQLATPGLQNQVFDRVEVGALVFSELTSRRSGTKIIDTSTTENTQHRQRKCLKNGCRAGTGKMMPFQHQSSYSWCSGNNDAYHQANNPDKYK
jgi:hypothetical protein